ncbi:MAG TPA: CDP-alcohol phosphatidyltransferase family protein, partial [Thermoleophilaceae bacterium]|nr:CDP-alcohol phosphatidyltransferase family protein [Thermoleophilaceae bacterium]
MTTRAIVFATAPAADGGIAAALRLGDTTPLERLAGQLGDAEVHVIARPMFASAIDSLLPQVTVHNSADSSSDLRVVAELARSAHGDLLLLPGELVTQPTPLDRLGTGTAALTRAEPTGSPVRALAGQVLSASSGYHWVGAPSAFFAGIMQVEASSKADLAVAADRLMALVQSEEPDLVPYLLTALVRDGTRVAARDARTQFWARPQSKEEAERTATELARYDEDRARLDAAVKANDGFFTTFFVSSYSRFVARAAARIGLTPNQITVLSMFLGLLAAAGFATGHRWGLIAGALLLQVAFMFDCVDGQLARYTRTFSRFGAWLDSVFDRGKEYLVYAGLAIGSVRGFGVDVWPLAAAALSLQTVRHMLEFSYWEVHYKALAEAPRPPLDQPGDRPGPPPGEDAGLVRAPAAVHNEGGAAARALGIPRP